MDDFKPLTADEFGLLNSYHEFFNNASEAQKASELAYLSVLAGTNEQTDLLNQPDEPTHTPYVPKKQRDNDDDQPREFKVPDGIKI